MDADEGREDRINVVRGRAATSSTARRTTVDERVLGRALVSYRASRRASLRRGIGTGEHEAARGSRRRGLRGLILDDARRTWQPIWEAPWVVLATPTRAASVRAAIVDSREGVDSGWLEVRRESLEISPCNYSTAQESWDEYCI